MKHRHGRRGRRGGLTLAALPVGFKARIVGFRGRGRFACRANGMGFYVGAGVEKLQEFGRHYLIRVGDCKMGLGRSAARRIFVRCLDGRG